MSSIADAIARQRPDLNKRTRFERLGGAPERPVPVFVPDLALELSDLPDPPVHDGWFGLPWLASGRSRILVTLLGASCLGIAIGYFPQMGRVSGHVEPPRVALVEVTDATLDAAVDRELDRVERQVASADVFSPAARAWSVPDVTPTPSSAAEQVAEPLDGPVVVRVQTRPAPPAGHAVQFVVEPAAPMMQPAAPSMDVYTPVSYPDVPVADPYPVVLPAVSQEPGAAGFRSAVPGSIEPVPDEVLYEATPTPDFRQIGTEPARKSSSAQAAAPAARSASVGNPSRGSALVLSGIFWDETSPMAMINGEIYEVGQSVGSAVIQEIRPEVVVLRENGNQRLLGL